MSPIKVSRPCQSTTIVCTVYKSHPHWPNETGAVVDKQSRYTVGLDLFIATGMNDWAAALFIMQKETKSQ